MNIVVTDAPTILFARSPSDAFACKLASLSFIELMRENRAVREKLADAERFVDAKGSPYDALNLLDDDRAISEAPVYWWSADTAAALTNAAGSYPITRPMHIPTLHHAFCVCEAPALWLDVESRREPITVLWWVMSRLITRGMRPALKLGAQAWTGRWGVPVFWSTVEDPLGTDVPADDGLRDDALRFERWICAASMLVEQRIVTAEQMAPTRQLRKQGARLHIDPAVSVVRLRRTSTHHAEGLGEREYSCRWIVSGHWRNQWYPRSQRHAPVGVSPYIKGPESMPLREPSPTVFAVVR